MAEHNAKTNAETTPSSGTHEAESGPHKRNTEPTDAQTPQAQAKQTAQEVGQRLSTESLDAAYQELKGDVDTAKTSMSGADFKKYRAELTKSLQESGMLPQLSLAWAEKAFGRLDADNSQFVEKPEAEAYATGTHRVDELTASMAKSFSQQINETPAKREDLRRVIDEHNPVANGEVQSQLDVAYLAQPRPSLNGMSLLQALDLNGAGGDQEKVDGKISKQDVESLLKNQLANLGEDEHAFLVNMVDNWESPQFMRLRDEQGLITPDSIKVATGEVRAHRERESLEKQRAEQDAEERAGRLAEIHKDFLTEKREGLNGMSIFDAADKTGAQGDKSRVDGLVGKADLEALLNNPLQRLNSDEEEAYLRTMIDNWDKPEFKGLRGGREFLTTESLKKASANMAGMCGLEPTEAETSASQGKSAAIMAEYLLKPSDKLDGRSIFDVADQVGAAGDKARVDGRISLEDLKNLLENPLQRFGNEEEGAFLKHIIERWDSPEVTALRSGLYIDSSRLKALKTA